MSFRRALGRLGVGVVLLAFVGGVFLVFGLQFRGGMTYPEGSTLRADPRGTMILFESLEAWPELRAQRLLDPLHRLEPEPDQVTLVVLNANPRLIRHRPLVEFVQKGGRVVFQPYRIRERRTRDSEEEEDEEENGREFLDKEENLIREEDSLLALLKVRRARRDDDVVALRVQGGEAAPGRVQWSGGDVFELPRQAPAHRVLYSVNEGPVVLGVTEESGEWILIADAVPLLNQAMFADAQADWLLWLLGEREAVVFWEYPMGIQQPRGVMTLIRQYRLTPVLGVLMLVFVLWVWQGAVPLLPVVPESEEPERGAQSRLDGLRDLLKRYLPAESIIPRCLEEWRADLSRSASNPERLAPLWDEARRQAQAPLPKRNREALVRERYQHLHEHITSKKSNPKNPNPKNHSIEN